MSFEAIARFRPDELFWEKPRI